MQFKCRLTCLNLVQSEKHTDVADFCDAASILQKCKTLSNPSPGGTAYTAWETPTHVLKMMKT